MERRFLRWALLAFLLLAISSVIGLTVNNSIRPERYRSHYYGY